MTQMTPALDAALAGPRPIAFAAIRMQLPTTTVRLIVGAGYLNFNGEDYTGRDPVFGVFSNIDTLSDGVGDEAPSLTITLVPHTDADTAAVASVEMQNSVTQIWLGAIDPISGQVIGVLELVDGLLDVPTINIDENGLRSIDYEITSIFEDFFIADDGCRLSDGFHQYLWPDELGCSFVTYVTHQLYWGEETPDGVTT